MRLVLASVLLIAAIGLVGCVSQTEADQTSTAYRKQLELNEELRRKIDELNARIKLLEKDLATSGLSDSAQVATLRDERNLLIKQRNDLIAQNRTMQSQIANLEERIKNMPKEKEVVEVEKIVEKEKIVEVEKVVVKNNMITPELDKALKNFAARFPDLASYDSAKGMIQLRSDVTFALGSDKVQRAATQSIAQLAGILKAPEASEYEVRVVGHTDSVRIAKAETKRRHPDNWYLSVHRAVAVREVLEAAGVPSTRLSVAGYGPNRPVVENTRRGAEANRRVELYLVPMKPLDKRLESSIGNQGPTSSGGAPTRDDAADDFPMK